MIRVAHATDIHWFRPPGWRQMSPKRMLGTANLYLRNRRGHFDASVQDQLVEDILAQEPDLVILSGDLTAQATEDEFLRAREVLSPILDTIPTLIVPGNHDVYTQGSQRAGRMRTHFEPWMHLAGPIGHLQVEGLTVIGLDPTRPHATASGLVPADQLDALRDALRGVPDENAALLVLHYPVVDRAGALYDHWEHGLRNADALVHTLEACCRRPDAILHGHVHHGYRSELHLSDDIIPTFDPGSSGYAYMPERHRAACFNVYEIAHGDVQSVKRFRYAGSAFEPEPGGAYASGR